MAGALSGHLIDQFRPHNTLNSSIVSNGPMSFNPSMHGTPYSQHSFSLFGSEPSFTNDSISEETARRIATLQVKLDQKLGPEYISQRPGPGGGPKLTYVEGWKIINLANEVFGFNGWSSSVVSLTTDFMDYNEETRRYNVGVTALMRVTLRDGVFHEDVGYGMLENAKSKGMALDKCKKEAVTDGLKRALRSFGNVMGNCLYDKSYTAEVIKVKFEPKKFNKDELHRRPEFEDAIPNVSSASTNTTASTTNHPLRTGHSNYATSTPIRPPMQQNQARPVTSLPAHMQSEARSVSAVQQTNAQSKIPIQPTGFNTPITTPLQQRTSIGSSKPQQQQTGREGVSAESRPPSIVSNPPTAAPPGPAKTELDEDDSFGFTSDDDAFLALADLGPAISAEDSDMERPIMPDDDMGRPIDHEEGLLRRPDDDESLEMPSNQRREVIANTSSASASSSSAGSGGSRTRQELIAAALATRSQEEAANAKSTNGMNQQNQARPESFSTGGTSASSGMRPPPVPQSRTTTTTLVQQNHQRYLNNRQNKDQNQAPGNDAQKKSLPSMGGFNFPSGVNSAQSGRNAPPSGIGVKRPAEANNLSTSGSSYRGASPGMGLHQAGAGPTHERRILGALDITDSGDVKRRRI